MWQRLSRYSARDSRRIIINANNRYKRNVKFLQFSHHHRNLSGSEIAAFVISSKFIISSITTIIGIGGVYWYFSDDEYIYDGYDAEGIVDYEILRNEIRSIMYSSEYDDGCCAPLLLRLAFNQCATYSKYDGLGGMNGSTLRFEPQISYSHNNGLNVAMKILETLYGRYYNRISYADLWTLASYVAIEEMGGPYIEFVSGRKDYDDNTEHDDSYKLQLAEERFPEWDCGVSRLLDWFDRMNLSDREGVSLMGAHSCGRLHSYNCGIDGSWSDAQILTNEYYKNFKFIPYLYERRGNEHYFDPSNPELILLPIEGSFFYNARCMRWAEFYAYADLHIWLNDFAATWKKITEQGCNLQKNKNPNSQNLKLYNIAGQ